MHRIQFSDTKNLKAFLSVNDVESVDVFCTEKFVRMISYTNEIFACIDVPADRSKDQKDVVCRINSKILSSVSDDSVLEIEEKDGKIFLYFLHSSGQLYYSCSFTHQVVYDTIYFDRLKIIEECDSDIYIDSDQLIDVAKIAKIYNSCITVEKGVAGVVLRSGPRVYKKINTSRSFSVTGDALNALRKCSTDFVSIKNYLYAAREGFSVLVKKVNDIDNSEYEFLHSKKFGAKCIVRLNFKYLLTFFTKTRIKVESILVKVDKKCVEVEGFNSVFTIPIELDVVKLAEGAKVDDFYVPSSVLFGILDKLKGSEYFLRQKKSFLQLDQGDYTVVW